ncbi:hypothetical protein M2132_001042 [Dysgonomonas sp. PH5-45]|uniref:hypothetical protein n=1 Tax=unclassified Dysgonomonas TaxID=2630389 RepID=UPI0024750482|nr:MULTISPECIES: hypothetical protein [unclassified Dysgonomonas]MDH6354713.1 hypothetical protein [Dysgonomonas sp. PH5-45]MDH6387612.1 hypothetical protein [Dysgonomonas sp. PH5-37]
MDRLNKQFEIHTISRQTLIDYGYDEDIVMQLSDSDMQSIASDLNSSYTEWNNLFGSDMSIIPEKYINQITKENMKKIDLSTFENCCKYLEIAPNLPDVSMLPATHAKALVSNYRLWVIAEAWNKEDNFIPDYDNDSQRKYYAWFWKYKEGFRFNDSTYYYSNACTGGGSHLCFKTPERAKQFAEMFIDLHNDVLLF